MLLKVKKFDFLRAKEYNKYIKVVYYYGERGDVMAEIDTSSWKEFRLDELFDIETTQGFLKTRFHWCKSERL